MKTQAIFSNVQSEPEWDNFAQSLPIGHYSQSCFWAKMKALNGWETSRIILKNQNKILGGAQILTKTKKGIVKIGYLSKGPLLTNNDEDTLDLIFKEIVNFCRNEKVHILAVQPPNDCHYLTEIGKKYGLVYLPYENINPPGTSIIDLSQPEEKIFNNFTREKRKNIRRAEKRGITVKYGLETDIEIAHDLVISTYSRKNLSKPFSKDYLKAAWDCMKPGNNLEIFLAEYEEQPLAVLLIIPFGDTVFCWRSGWNGTHKSKYPNEAVYWKAIQWAKEKGYQYFDFGGIHTQIVQDIQDGKSISESDMDGVSAFKLGFQGKMEFHPETQIFIRSSLIRKMYQTIEPIIPAIVDSPIIQKFIWRG